MALTSPDSLRTKGALASFHDAVGAAPEVFRNNCQIVQSDTNAETYSFPGFVPQPRLFLDSRQYQNFRDFTFTLTNNEYELSMIVNRTHWEDDQTGLIRARFSELGDVWGGFKDNLFAQLLAAGSDAGNLAFDGTVFFTTDHSTGTGITAEANSNDLTSNIGDISAATVAELKIAMITAIEALWNFTDDTGSPINANGAMNNMRLICGPGHASAAMEFMSSTDRPGASGGDSPAWSGGLLAGVDVLPWIASDDHDEIYITANGVQRRGFIYQERTPLEIIILDGANDVAENNGVKVLTRQRFVMTYGDYRRAVLHTFT